MKGNFIKFKRKIFFQLLYIVLLVALAGSFLVMVAVDGVLQNPFAELFVFFTTRLLDLSEPDAITLFHRIFQNNKTLWLALGFAVLLLLCFRLMVSRFTRAFDQISQGIHELSLESDRPILLPPELDAMQEELNATRKTLRQRKQDMLASEQRKNDLVMYLAHDLKTPLTSVIGYLSLLQNAPDMPKEQRAKYTGITLNKARRLELLINEFFEITRFDLDSLPSVKKEIDLSLMLEQMADEFYPILTRRGLKAEVSCPEGLSVAGDPDKLARVFNNLLKNAAAYSKENTSLQIFASSAGPHMVTVRVRNQGRQIPPEQLSLIFDQFYRLEAGRNSNSGGAGLGLAIAKRITEAHGGTIRAFSSPEYTEFVVNLPRF